MASVLSLSEIEQQFTSEWILVDDPQANADLEVERGVVLFNSHDSHDRDAVYREAIRLHPRRFAVLFTGELPIDMAISL